MPEEFRDLTWIEEMVCAKYRNTAHVTRIYGSSDPSQPRVFHGNTCAHEMNVLSTATVLPRTVADMNDIIRKNLIWKICANFPHLEGISQIRK